MKQYNHPDGYGSLIAISVRQAHQIIASADKFDVFINIALGQMGGLAVNYHWKEMGPSSSLFQWSKANKHTDWWPVYKERFTNERGKVYREKVRRIANMVRDGKTVYIICFCADENMCHRSLVFEDVVEDLV